MGQNRNNTTSRQNGQVNQYQSPKQFKRVPKRSDNIDMGKLIRIASLQKAMGGRVKQCTFCRTKGEAELIYMSHSLKDATDRITL